MGFDFLFLILELSAKPMLSYGVLSIFSFLLLLLFA